MMSVSQAGELNGEEVLARVDKSVGEYENIVLAAKVIDYDAVNSEATKAVFTTSVELKRTGSRIVLSSKALAERPSKDTWRQQIDQVVGENGEVILFQSKLDDAMKQVEGLHPGLSISVDSEKLSGSQGKDLQSVLYGLNDGGAAVWVVGYASIREMLKSAKPTNVELRDGVAEIRADGANGQIRVLVSEASGWLPQTFEIVKSKHHETVGGLVGVIFENKVTSVVWTGKAGGFRSDSAGRWWPGEIEVVRRTEWIDQPAEVTTTKITINSVEFDVALTDNDFRTSLVFPANFPVTVHGADHLPYKWNGSEPVPGIPDRPPRPNKVYEETTPAKQRIGMVWLGGASILLFIAIVALLKRRN